MNRLTFLKDIKFRRPAAMQIGVIAAGILLAIGGYFFTRGLVTCWTLTPLAGDPPASCGTVTEQLNGPNLTNSEGTPVPNVEDLPPPITIPDSNLPPAWDGASRINILIIGLDFRDWVAGEGAPRSDTMIVLTVDPLTKQAGILSIPRDLWVNIPGFGYGRINMAYFHGEGNKLPGGGPELARKTVEQLLGVPIQYYAQVDFYAFVEFIDMIGGIEIYNDENLRLDPVGEGKDKIRLTCCGMRTLNGERALAYARFRKDKEGDIARANRQQKVILGIRNKVLSPENFPVLVAQAQQFYEKLSAGVHTNMPFDVALRLGVLAKDIPVESIQHGVIDYSMVALAETTLGGERASVMKPLPDKIRELRDQIFSGGAVSPLAAQSDLTTMMREDAARVRVLNGSVVGGLESTTGQFLATQGMQVTELGPADGGYNSTVIVLYSPKLYTMKYFQSLFGITDSARIWISPNPASTVDVEIRLGNDWANNNPMP
ncbi:MAG TPA: LCP family protein [Anaerolineales bacterium]|nr:LCP family protein [Anaerolineales bacterium]